LPRGVVGTVAVAAAVWAVGVCLSATPTAVASVCGTCSGSARASLYGEAAWAVGASVAAALVARFASAGEFRVARSAALVALLLWLVSVGFVRGWW
jgi:hypothetical protein